MSFSLHKLYRSAIERFSDEQNRDDTARKSEAVVEKSVSVKAAPHSRAVISLTGWNQELLQAIEWKRFGALCVTLLKSIGLNAGAAADGDGFIEIFSTEDRDELIAIARCKAWSEPVDVDEMRYMHALMASRQLEKGYYLSASTFSEKAADYASSCGIGLIDKDRFLMLLSVLPEVEALALLSKATTGDYTTPACPSCGCKMVADKADKPGDRAWVCSTRPQCDAMLPMPEQ